MVFIIADGTLDANAMVQGIEIRSLRAGRHKAVVMVGGSTLTWC